MTRERPNPSLRQLPPVDALLRDPELAVAVELYGRPLVVVQAREELDRLRARIRDEEGLDVAAECQALAKVIASSLAAEKGRPLERVLNATGIFLHTNLGRAPLPRQVACRLPSLLDAYCDLELDLDSGRRSDRNLRVARLLEAATQADAALVLNNNAAAMVLILATLARGREVIVSRGELVEIGGSFRIPDLIEATGATLIEVGTTNRTLAADYRRAITERTALLLKVYPSNYRQAGYVASVEPAELVELAAEHELAVVVDEGSGLLRPHPSEQLRGHPSVSELVATGCDLVCASGDKLVGGPQAGLLVGDPELVERCRHHPLYRALRPDRAALAALEAVLRIHLTGGALPLAGLWPEEAAHRARLESLARRLDARIVLADAFIGGGSAPDRPIPGAALALEDSASLAEKLRTGSPPVVGYARKGNLILDLRTVAAEDDDLLVAAVRAARSTPRR